MPIHSNPVGTLDEIEALELSGEEYGTCSMPRKADNIGCRFYPTCSIRKRLERQGIDAPINGGVRLIQRVDGRRVAVNERPMACFLYQQTRISLHDKGGLAKWICDEGGTIKMKTSVRVHPNDPKSTLHKTVLEDFEVPKFPRPTELGGALEDQQYLVELQQDAERDEAARERELLGLKTADHSDDLAAIPASVRKLLDEEEGDDGRKGDSAKPKPRRRRLLDGARPAAGEGAEGEPDETGGH